MLYYQAWAEAAHYQIQKRRPCLMPSPRRISCAVTVTDDFGAALGYVATDTFSFSFEDDRLTEVTFAGDDPIRFWLLLTWIWVTRGEVFENECQGMFAGGETPAACARSVAEAARDFAQWWPPG